MFSESNDGNGEMVNEFSRHLYASVRLSVSRLFHLFPLPPNDKTRSHLVANAIIRICLDATMPLVTDHRLDSRTGQVRSRKYA